MPVYQYECVNCGNRYDVFYTRIGVVAEEEPKERCPRCQSIDKERLVSTGTTFQVKTDGFYSNTPAKESRKKD